MKDKSFGTNDWKEVIAALRMLKVQTGSFACLGCGYEQSCGVGGCAILRAAADLLEQAGAGPAPANEQLTPETLKGMVREAGKPVVVWTVSLEDDGSLYLDSGEWEMFDGNDFSAPGTLDDLSHYGPRPHGYFVAYLRPPEGKEGGG